MVTAVFNCGDYARTVEIWQWDYGQVLRIQGLSLPTATEIHFALQEAGGESVTRIGVTKDGVTDVTIPDSLLENDGTTQRYSIYAFIYLTDTNSGQTIKKITIPVKSRPKPQAFDKPEDAQLFRDAIKAVNDAADRAGTSEKLAEGWAHGREDMPERAQDNAMYYAGKTAEDARQTESDRKAVKELVDSVSGIEQQVETIKGYADQAAKSQESSEGAAKAAGESATAAELSRQQAGQYATDAAERASDASDSADQASGYATKAGQAYESTAELAQQVQTDINQAGDTQVKAINSAGATQVQAIKSEGGKQVQAVQDAAQEIAADREQIKTNKEDIADLKDQILPLAIKATSDKAEILDITDSADFKMQGFNLYGRTEQVQTNGYQLFDGQKAIPGNKGGATMTVNDDGSILISGNGKLTEVVDIVSTLYTHSEFASLFKAGKITLKTGVVTCPHFQIDFVSSSSNFSLNNYNNTDTSGTITNEMLSDEKAYVQFRYYGASGSVIKQGTIKPMLYQDGDGTWEPFTGGFPSPRPQMRSKNLANPDDIVIGGLAVDTGLELVTNNRIRTGYIPVTAGASYKYRAIYDVSNAHTYNTDKTRVGNYSSNVPIPEGVAYIRMSFGKIDNSDLTNDDLDNFKDTFMFNEGNTALPYEPYLIPEWPQEIVNAGRLNEETGKYEVPVKVTGKNLFDASKIPTKSQGGATVTNNGDGSFTIQGSGKLTETFSFAYEYTHEETITLLQANKIIKVNQTSPVIPTIVMHLLNGIEPITVSKNGYTITTEDINNPNFKIKLVVYGGVGTNIVSGTYKPMIYQDGDDIYEPYKEQSITLTSDRPLTKWDYLDRRDGVWGWVYGGKIYENFNGDGHAVYMGPKVGDIQHFRVIFNDAKDDTLEKLYCNKFLAIIASYTKEQYAICSNWTGGTKYFSAPNENITTVDEFKQWLKNNPLCLAYQVKDSTFHPLPKEQQDALRSLTTYYPTTIITNNASAQMQAQYVADPANYIANHYVSKEDTQTIMQRISNIETAMLKL